MAAPALGQVSPAGLYPPPPVPPAVITRDGGGVTVRAERVATPLRIDGQLNESAYQDVLAISEFIQNDPAEGEPASEETEVWLLFDDDYVYVVARCWESQPDRLVANEMRRDNTRIVRDDNFAWSFDTFYDRRNGYLFEVSAVGGRIDGQFTNESQLNIDWNPVYGRRGRPVRRRLDDGGGLAVQVAALSGRRAPGVGVPGPPRQTAGAMSHRT